MIKRLFDIVCAAVLIIFLLPLILLTTIILLFTGCRPVLYTPARPGKNNDIFNMIKFRSMTEQTDKNGKLLPDSERLTAFGKFIRKTSIDEIPSLWNVLVGHMSLVGPRPLLVEYLPLYSDEQAKRHNVKPGITGWAQINGRNAISWEEKFALDVWYVDNQSFWLDIKILLLTVKKVFAQADINADGEATMSKFKGSSHD